MTGRAVAALVAGILGLLLVTAAGGTALIDGG
jgi:hypothetical protein